MIAGLIAGASIMSIGVMIGFAMGLDRSKRD